MINILPRTSFLVLLFDLVRNIKVELIKINNCDSLLQRSYILVVK